MIELGSIARKEPLGAAVFYMALFGTYGIYLPFFPVFLSGRGLSESEIAIVLAAPMAMRVIFAPLTGTMADRMADRRSALILFSWLSVAAFAGLYWARGFSAILVVTIGYAIFWTAIVPVIDAITLGLERRKGHNYGKIRLWGSIAFIVLNIAVGSALEGRSEELIYWLLLVGGTVTAFMAFAVPSERRPAAEARQLENTPSAFQVLLRPAFLAMLTGSALIQASHAMIYGFGTLYWSGIGLSGWQIGTLWAIGVVTEVMVFGMASRLLGWTTPVGLIVIGGVASILRWVLFPLVEDFPSLLVLQALHGLSFGATYLGTVHYISNSVPERMAARAQGSYATLGSATLAVGVLSTGPLFSHFAGMAFALMAPVAVIALVLVGFAPWLERRYPHNSGAGG